MLHYSYRQLINIYLHLIYIVNLFVLGNCNDLKNKIKVLLPSGKPENQRFPHNFYDPSPYNLEKFCDRKDSTVEIPIPAWKAAIFQFGLIHNANGTLVARTIKHIHTCEIHIRTEKKFWLVAGIEHLKIRGKQDSNSKWKCSDYLQFSSPARHFLGRIFSFFDLHFFDKKQSSKLCGSKKLVPSVMENTRIYDTSTDANSFSTAANEMKIVFHQDDSEKGLHNNSFRVVVTSVRHAGEEDGCKDKQTCYGYGQEQFCIDKKFICDGHINCAFPGSGTDEKLCDSTMEESKSSFNVTLIVVFALVSAIGFGLLFCVISSIACKMKNKLESSRRSTSRNRPPPSAHDFDFVLPDDMSPSTSPSSREGTLPRYEAVILSDQEEALKQIESKAEEELPPQYQELFPEGPPPPKQQSDVPHNS